MKQAPSLFNSTNIAICTYSMLIIFNVRMLFRKSSKHFSVSLNIHPMWYFSYAIQI